MSEGASAGKIIEGKYRLEKKLGAGGMGAVWLATQLMVERHVAVKLLHPAFIDSDDLQARFEVEAKAIGRLNHPNCITLFDFGYSDELGAFYTVIEYIEGVALDKKLGQPLPIGEIIDLSRQISMALDHAHHQGILHRDLKPENIMLARMTDGSEMVKVLDFGIARLAKGDSVQDAERITKAGEVFGTPAYMSPEQARSTRQLSGSSDLYALGVMMFELVEGHLPFFAKSAFDILMMHVTQPVPELEREGVPDRLKELIYSLLQKDPEARPQSGKEVVEILDDIPVLDEPTVSSDSRRHTTTPQPTLVTPPPDSSNETVPSMPPLSFNDAETAFEDGTTISEAPPRKRIHVPALVAIALVSTLLLGLVLVNVFELDDAESGSVDELPIAAPAVESDEKLNVTNMEPRPANTSVGPDEASRLVESLRDTGDPVQPDDLPAEADSPPDRVESIASREQGDGPAKANDKKGESGPSANAKTNEKSAPRPARKPKQKPAPQKESKPVFPSLSTSDNDDDRVQMPSVDL